MTIVVRAPVPPAGTGRLCPAQPAIPARQSQLANTRFHDLVIVVPLLPRPKNGPDSACTLACLGATSHAVLQPPPRELARRACPYHEPADSVAATREFPPDGGISGWHS